MCLKNCKYNPENKYKLKINTTNRIIHFNINLQLSPVSLLIIFMFKICTALNRIRYINYLQKALPVALAQLYINPKYI